MARRTAGDSPICGLCTIWPGKHLFLFNRYKTNTNGNGICRMDCHHAHLFKNIRSAFFPAADIIRRDFFHDADYGGHPWLKNLCHPA